MLNFAAFLYGLSLEQISSSFNKPIYIPGRLETVYNKNNKMIIVDYAHTPDAFENVLNTIAKLKPKKIITVFGCGGNRDIAKRSLMASIAEKYSSKVIVTADNPRNEDLNKIFLDIKSGFKYDKHTLITDRSKALLYAIKKMKSGSILLVLGKGIENYQEVNGIKIPYDEKKVILEILNES